MRYGVKIITQCIFQISTIVEQPKLIILKTLHETIQDIADLVITSKHLLHRKPTHQQAINHSFRW